MTIVEQRKVDPFSSLSKKQVYWCAFSFKFEAYKIQKHGASICDDLWTNHQYITKPFRVDPFNKFKIQLGER